MKAKFLRPVCIDGADYGKGEHQLPESLKEHWYFNAAVVNGWIVCEHPAKVSVEQTPPVEAPAAPAEPAAEEVAPSEEQSEEEAKEGKKKKKSKKE